jgi:hypothetical protein
MEGRRRRRLEIGDRRSAVQYRISSSVPYRIVL